MGAEHFKRALGSCNLKPAEGWAGGSSKKQMWLHQTRTVLDSHRWEPWQQRPRGAPGKGQLRDSSAVPLPAARGAQGRGWGWAALRGPGKWEEWLFCRWDSHQETSPRMGSHQHQLCPQGWAVLGSWGGFSAFQASALQLGTCSLSVMVWQSNPLELVAAGCSRSCGTSRASSLNSWVLFHSTSKVRTVYKWCGRLIPL